MAQTFTFKNNNNEPDLAWFGFVIKIIMPPPPPPKKEDKVIFSSYKMNLIQFGMILLANMMAYVMLTPSHNKKKHETDLVWFGFKDDDMNVMPPPKEFQFQYEKKKKTMKQILFCLVWSFELEWLRSLAIAAELSPQSLL